MRLLNFSESFSALELSYLHYTTKQIKVHSRSDFGPAFLFHTVNHSGLINHTDLNGTEYRCHMEREVIISNCTV